MRKPGETKKNRESTENSRGSEGGIGALRITTKLSEGFEIAASFCLIGLIVFLTINIILRYFFAKPLVFTEEITAYGLAFVVFMGLGSTLRKGGHVVTDVLVRHFPEKIKRIVKFPIVLVGLIFSVIFCISSLAMTIKNFSRKAIDFGSLGTPEWIPNLIFVAGSTIFFLEMMNLLLRKKTRE